MWALITAFFTALTSGFTFFKNLFGSKASNADTTQDAASKAVAQSNEAGKVSADVSRQTELSTNQGLQNADAETSSYVDRVHSADGLRDQNTAVADAINDVNASRN